MRSTGNAVCGESGMKSVDTRRESGVNLQCGLERKLTSLSYSGCPLSNLFVNRENWNTAFDYIPKHFKSPWMRVGDPRAPVREQIRRTKRHVNRFRISREQLPNSTRKGPDLPAGIVRRCFSDSLPSVKRARTSGYAPNQIERSLGASGLKTGISERLREAGGNTRREGTVSQYFGT